MPKSASSFDLNTLFSTIEGKTKFGLILLEKLSIQNIARTVLRVDKLPLHAVPMYETEDGRIYIQESEVANNIRIDFATLKRLISNGKNALLAAIANQFTIPQQEDELLFERLKELEVNVLTYRTEESILTCFLEMISRLETKGAKPVYMLANPRLCPYLDGDETAIGGVKFLRSDLCEVNDVYVFPEKDCAGAFAIRTSLTCAPQDDPTMLTVGYVIFENVGIFVQREFVLRFNLCRKKYKNKFEFFNATWKENEAVTA
jgi:hypothetical protein